MKGKNYSHWVLLWKSSANCSITKQPFFLQLRRNYTSITLHKYVSATSSEAKCESPRETITADSDFASLGVALTYLCKVMEVV